MWIEKNAKIYIYCFNSSYFKDTTHKKQYLMSIEYYANIILKFI
jgi:hypothetical protein